MTRTGTDRLSDQTSDQHDDRPEHATPSPGGEALRPENGAPEPALTTGTAAEAIERATAAVGTDEDETP